MKQNNKQGLLNYRKEFLHKKSRNLLRRHQVRDAHIIHTLGPQRRIRDQKTKEAKRRRKFLDLVTTIFVHFELFNWAFSRAVVSKKSSW